MKSNTIGSLLDEKKEFSFNASGWLQIFQMGVVYFFQRHIELKTEKISAVGTSAGATTAAILILGVPADLAAEKACLQENLIKKDFKSMVPVMQKAVREMTPANAMEHLEIDRFGIVCSEFTNCCKLTTVEFRKFNKREDIVELLCATCHIPIFSGYWPYRYNDKYLYDGLFTTTHPREPGEPGSNKSDDKKNVIYISWTPNCVCGCTKKSNDNFTIAPSVEMPLRWCMLPQAKENLRLIFYHGYCQAYRKFNENPDLRALFKFNGDFESIIEKKTIKIDFDQEKNDEKCSLACDTEIYNRNKAVCHLMSSKIDGENADQWELARANQDKIANYILDQVTQSDREWSGCSGCMKYFCMFLRIFFPCLPIVCCVQACLVERRNRRMSKDEEKKINVCTIKKNKVK